MWCANCQADVAAEVSVDNKRIRCATCGTDISAAPTPPPEANTRDARELLERWSNNEMLDPFAPATGVSPPTEPQSSKISTGHQPATPAAPAPDPTPKFRIDSPHLAERTATPSEMNLQQDQRAPSSEARRLHPAHGMPTAPPHFDVQPAAGDRKTRKRNVASLIGQLLAYAGVGVLTIGTSLVLWSYFGGPASYMPTGWLITTAGQMLLFLGVVTLVSGGMEQTGEDVARRIETIGDRILRIEQASRNHALKGPSIPAERFVDGAPSRDERTVVEQQTGEGR